MSIDLKRTVPLALTIGLCVAPGLFGFSPASSETVGYHTAKVDSKGRLVPWYGNTPPEAYDHVLHLVWNFWRNMRTCPDGVPYYLQHQVWKPGQDDPRGLGGDQLSMALSSWNLLYDYLGDPAVKSNMVLIADYWLAHGMSNQSSLWANLPYPYNTELHSGQYDGDMRAGKNFLQPDKAGSFGAELVTLYKITGNTKYLNAATAIADSLIVHVGPGDAENSPWPFRVNALTGAVHQAAKKDGTPLTASYTSNWTPTLRLFSGLVALHHGKRAEYEKCSRLVTAWLKQYPLRTNKWGPFFEDIPTEDYSDTEINADTLAAYILEHPEWDARSKEQARGILQWSYSTFANHEFEKWSVTVINEQTVYRVPGNSHTSRHASVELLYCEKSGDCASKEDAVRRLNWATYAVDVDGKNRYPRDDVWLTDGYGDYVRHFLRAMAAAPELAPENQNHLLQTSSVVQSIDYKTGQINYTKFDEDSTELFKLGAARPTSLNGGRWHWDASKKLLTVQANRNSVQIALEPSQRQ
jgi:hypothetical protein